MSAEMMSHCTSLAYKFRVNSARELTDIALGQKENYGIVTSKPASCVQGSLLIDTHVHIAANFPEETQNPDEFLFGSPVQEIV